MFKEFLSAWVNAPKLPSTSYPDDSPVIDLMLSKEDTVELPDVPCYDFDIFRLGFNFFSIIFIIMYLYVCLFITILKYSYASYLSFPLSFLFLIPLAQSYGSRYSQLTTYSFSFPGSRYGSCGARDVTRKNG